MLFESFNCLVMLLSQALAVDEFQSSSTAKGAEAIIPEPRVHCALQYLSGGSSHDVWSFTGMSKIPLIGFFGIHWMQ